MREQHVDAAQAVNLHEIEDVGLEATLGLLDHRDAFRQRTVARRHLGGDEGLLAIANVGEQFSDDLLRLAVCRCRVDHRGARGGQTRENLSPGSTLFGRRRTVVVSTDADRCQTFACRRHRLGHQWACRGRLRFVLGFVSGPRTQCLSCSEGRQAGFDDVPTSCHFFLRTAFAFFFVTTFFASLRVAFFATFLRTTFLAAFFFGAAFFFATTRVFGFGLAFDLAFGLTFVLDFGAALAFAIAVVECTANAAPFGSITMAIRPPLGMSIGGTIALAPAANATAWLSSEFA